MNKAGLERALKKVGASTALKPVHVIDTEGNEYEIVSVVYKTSDGVVFIHVADVLDEETEDAD